MQDVLGNHVHSDNFIPNEVHTVPKGKDTVSKYYHQTLVSDMYVFIRVINKAGDILGWNKLPKATALGIKVMTNATNLNM